MTYLLVNVHPILRFLRILERERHHSYTTCLVHGNTVDDCVGTYLHLQGERVGVHLH